MLHKVETLAQTVRKKCFGTIGIFYSPKHAACLRVDRRNQFVGYSEYNLLGENNKSKFFESLGNTKSSVSLALRDVSSSVLLLNIKDLPKGKADREKFLSWKTKKIFGEGLKERKLIFSSSFVGEGRNKCLPLYVYDHRPFSAVSSWVDSNSINICAIYDASRLASMELFTAANNISVYIEIVESEWQCLIYNADRILVGKVGGSLADTTLHNISVIVIENCFRLSQIIDVNNIEVFIADYCGNQEQLAEEFKVGPNESLVRYESKVLASDTGSNIDTGNTYYSRVSCERMVNSCE